MSFESFLEDRKNILMPKPPGLSATFSLDLSQFFVPSAKPSGIIVRSDICGLKTIHYTAWKGEAKRLRRVK